MSLHILHRIAGKLTPGCANLLWVYGYSSIRMPEMYLGMLWVIACITQIGHAVHCMKDIDQHMLVTVSAISHGHLSELLIRTCLLLSGISSVSIKPTAQPGGGVWSRFQRRAAGRSIEALYTESGDHEPFVTCPAGYRSSML